MLGAFQGVLELRREGLILYEKLAKRNSSSEDDQQGLAVAETRMASILMHENDMKGAVQHYREALRIQVRLYELHKGQTQHVMALGLAHSNLGNALRVSGDPKAALVALDDSVRLFEPMANADANEVRIRTLLATARLRQARAWNDLGDTARAKRMLNEVLEVRRFLAEKNPANSGARGEIAEAHGALGDVAFHAKAYSDAIAHYEKALQLLEALEKEGRSNAADSEEKARIQASLAEAGKKK